MIARLLIPAWFVAASLVIWHSAPVDAADAIELEAVASGLDNPLLVTNAGDGSNRLFIVEKTGRVLIFSDGQLLEQPFLDISSEISTGGERGLLGLAFDPEYANNGRFFVNFTDPSGDSVISRFSVSGNPDRAEANSAIEVLTFRQPFSNHNGGHLAFGPDGYLYIATGDGGSAGDPNNNAQDLGSLLGKMLRIDVDGPQMAIPPSNPFIGRRGAREEIWAYGLRNPWRFSFDRRTGDLFIADVGQALEEEIDFQAADSEGGENYGWKAKEGTLCFEPASGCEDPSFTDPIIVYGHVPHCSVTGGFRYRGRDNIALQGSYIYGDFCSGVIWGAVPGSGETWSTSVLLDTRLAITSFGEDEAGELYVVDLEGVVYRIAGGSALISDDFESGDFEAWRKSQGAVAIVQPGLKRSDNALSVTLEGSNTASILTATLPGGEKSISVRLLFNPNGADLDGEETAILTLRGKGKNLVWLDLEPRGARYRARLWVRQADGEEILVGQTTLKSDSTVLLGLDWKSSSAAGRTDGAASLIKGTKVRARQEALDTGSLAVKSLRVGLPEGTAGDASGSLLFDDIIVAN